MGQEGPAECRSFWFWRSESTVWRSVPEARDALPRGAAVRRPTAVSRAAPWMVDALRRVRRCTSRPAICRFVFGPFHYCAFCERAAPDAPETIHDQRRCTGCRDRTIYGGSRGSASLPTGPAPDKCKTQNYLLIGASRSECAA